MYNWNLEFSAPGIITWTSNTEVPLDLMIAAGNKDGRVVPQFTLGATYSRHDLIHLDRRGNKHAPVKLSGDQYWIILFQAWTPRELERSMREKYPLTRLPSDYETVYDRLVEKLNI